MSKSFKDVDVFHDTIESLAKSADLDFATLKAAGKDPCHLLGLSSPDLILNRMASLVEKRMYGKHSGMWESHTPCRLQNQPPESCADGGALYWLKREKSMRHTSPSFGGKARPSALASHFIPCHGKASSAVQPRSVSLSSLRVPSTWTAVLRPGNSNAQEPSRSPRG